MSIYHGFLICLRFGKKVRKQKSSRFFIIVVANRRKSKAGLCSQSFGPDSCTVTLRVSIDYLNFGVLRGFLVTMHPLPLGLEP